MNQEKDDHYIAYSEPSNNRQSLHSRAHTLSL